LIVTQSARFTARFRWRDRTSGTIDRGVQSDEVDRRASDADVTVLSSMGATLRSIPRRLVLQSTVAAIAVS
jgi:hypothetical protein